MVTGKDKVLRALLNIVSTKNSAFVADVMDAAINPYYKADVLDPMFDASGAFIKETAVSLAKKLLE